MVGCLPPANYPVTSNRWQMARGSVALCLLDRAAGPAGATTDRPCAWALSSSTRRTPTLQRVDLARRRRSNRHPCTCNWAANRGLQSPTSPTGAGEEAETFLNANKRFQDPSP